MRLDYRITLVESYCRAFISAPALLTRNTFQHFVSGLILVIVLIPLIFLFFSVLVSEGERCEVIGFIKKGECLRRRYINVACTLPNGKKVSAIKIPMPFPRYLFIIFSYIFRLRCHANLSPLSLSVVPFLTPRLRLQITS